MKYYAKKVPNKKWDYIVIGSGIGGMATAALLGYFGKKVLLLERHYQPGGFTHTFSRRGYTWDVGVHTIGQIGSHYLEGRILRTLTDNAVEWKSMGEVCEIFHYPDKTISIYGDIQKQIQMLSQMFPKERKAIQQYFSTVKKALCNLEMYYGARCLFPHYLSIADRILGRNSWKWFGKTTMEVMEPLFHNTKLFDILTARWVYYGSPPDESSFGIQAVIDRHFHEGGYYPVGGGKQLTTAFLKKIYHQGGETRVCAEVKQICIENDRAVGVELKNGEKIFAPRTVAAIPLHSLPKILPQPIPSWLQQVQKMPSTPAHLCLHLGFKEDIRTLGATTANAWLFKDYGVQYATWDVHHEETPGILYCSFPSLKEGKQKNHTAEIITFVPWESFAQWKDTTWKKRGAQYEEMKEQITQKILQRFWQYFPKLRNAVDYVELSTPLSTNHFMGTSNGSIYGLAPTPQRYHSPWTRPRTPLNGLFLSGSDMASPGIIGAMMGGVLAAVACCPVAGSKFLLKHMFAKK
ncbi:phytoene desaturase family protein [Candidatus Uabimicrobium amorphum]|uniref:Phytoene dehydrogenase n=1 Tax=Uabimicrobium amorphum TaxID=2596890 RepID=A0A5S9F3Q8_UABAM|nr:NAD(P)/FAD-dependent oxidoreductase [Candidatus Uabimicrobium amorphum]BBM84393.1 phytoene dehydrogenase [Candidatus Uabimicrobium amorphum]